MKEKFFLKKIIYLLLAVFLLTMNAQSFSMSVHAEEINGTGKITTDSLNVRSGPGKDYDAIGKVYSSETVTITGSENGWYLIDYNGVEGYVSAKYVEMEEAETIVATSSQEETEMSTAIDEEELAPHGIAKYKLPILIGVIVLVFIIILITLKGIKKLDEDDEDDEYDEYDEYEDDDDYEEEEDDEDEYEYEERRPVRKKPTARPRQSMYTVEEEEPVRRNKQTRPVQQTIKPARTQSAKSQSSQKELDMILSNNPDDYRIDIDPIFFEDDKKPSAKSYEDEKKEADLQKAMEKMEELQREIERIKNKR